MAEDSKIEWTDHTFNPWMGCTKVSPACKHCYAETLMDTRYGKVKWGKGQPRQRTAPANWRKPLKWERDAEAFFAEHGRRQRVFCASLADVFDDEVDQWWREDLWSLIVETPSLDWLLLTKRPEVMARARVEGGLPWNDAQWLHADGPWPNVWCGVTVEDQKRADERIPTLLGIAAAVRFLSMEPLLGPVDLWGAAYLTAGAIGRTSAVTSWEGHGVDWVIAGGESGPGARPSHPDWYRSIRDLCAGAGVPFLFKQWGEWVPGDGDVAVTVTGRTLTNLEPCGSNGSGTVRLMRPGKKAAGRELDGRTHDGFPEVRR